MLQVKDVYAVADITGHHLTSKWDVLGTDGGSPVYSASRHRMYMLFGDTYGGIPDEPMVETNWRGSVAGYFSDFDTSRGIRWDGFLCDAQGRAKELVRKHADSNEEGSEVTKICQGGIEVNGMLYFTYLSVRKWGLPGCWNANFCGVIRSADGGESFERVRDLTWVEPQDETLWPSVRRLAEENDDFSPSGYDFDVASHVAPGFAEMVLADGKDGYIYGYGRHSGRFHGMKVCRVKKSEFERFEAWEYLFPEHGEPCWLKGRQVRERLCRAPEEAEVAGPHISNMAVLYNNYLGKWLMIHHVPDDGVYGRESDTPYGPFSEPVLLISKDHPDILSGMPSRTDGNRLYAGYSHEMICRDGGRIIPVIISQWYVWPGQRRYYASRLFEVVLR